MPVASPGVRQQVSLRPSTMLAATYVTGRPAKSAPAGACAGAEACAKPATSAGGPVTVGVGELAVRDGEGEALVAADEESSVLGRRAGVGEVASAPPPVPWSRRKPPRTRTTTIATAA